MLERCAGIVFGFLIKGPGVTRVTDETLGRHLPQGHDCPTDWMWLHLSLADHRARRFLETWIELPDDARELMLGSEDRIQLHLTPGGGWGVLPDIERDFADQSLGSGRFFFWLEGSRLVTARRHSLRAIEILRHEIERGALPESPAHTLARLQEEFVWLLEQRLSVLTRDLGHLEDEVLADRYEGQGGAQARLGPVRRELSRYAREFSALRSAIHRATSARHGVAASPLMEHLPQLAQDAEDFNRDAAALSDRARLLYEEVETRIASTTNRSLSALTVISTLLLPPTFVVGAFGMNLEGITWARHPHGFGIVVGLCFLLVLGVYFVLRRLKILP